MAFTAVAPERGTTDQQVIMRALAGSLTWLQAADILNIHPRSLRRWRARYEQDPKLGLLLPASRPPPRCPCAGSESRSWSCSVSFFRSSPRKRRRLDSIKVATILGDIPQNVNFAINASVARSFLDANGVAYTTAAPGEPRSHQTSDSAPKRLPS